MAATSASCMANFAVALVSLQVGIQPFLTEKYISRTSIKSAIVIIQEVVKLVCIVVILTLTGRLFSVFSAWTLESSLHVALAPAMIYCLQNVLAYYAYLQLDPLTYNLINQSKIMFAAIFLKLILNKTQTKRQLIALLILFMSSIMLTLDTSSSSHYNPNPDRDTTLGLIAIITASIMSGLAGTLTQKALQAEGKPRDSLLFSCELSFYGVVFSGIRLYMENVFDVLDGEFMSQVGFFHDLHTTVLIPITVNAIGGIGVGLITKYASVLHKSYAMIFGILLSGVFRWMLYSTPMSKAMYLAVPMVMVSLWLHADPAAQKKKKKKE